MLNLFSKPTLLLILALMAGIIILVAIRIFFSDKPPSSPPPVIYQDPADRSKSFDSFKPSEMNYPEAKPQQYRSEAPGMGMLIITSEPEGTRVLIDSSEEEIPINNIVNPINITPFKVTSIPVGGHYIFAAKEGYNFTETDFAIKENEVTRVHLKLIPEERVGY